MIGDLKLKIAIWSFGIVFAGCAEAPSKSVEEYNELAARHNWALCQYAYKQNNVGMLFDHAHSNDENLVLIHWDLGQHSCKAILKDYWIEEMR